MSGLRTSGAKKAFLPRHWAQNERDRYFTHTSIARKSNLRAWRSPRSQQSGLNSDTWFDGMRGARRDFATRNGPLVLFDVRGAWRKRSVPRSPASSSRKAEHRRGVTPSSMRRTHSPTEHANSRPRNGGAREVFAAPRGKQRSNPQ